MLRARGCGAYIKNARWTKLWGRSRAVSMWQMAREKNQDREVTGRASHSMSSCTCAAKHVRRGSQGGGQRGNAPPSRKRKQNSCSKGEQGQAGCTALRATTYDERYESEPGQERDFQAADGAQGELGG